MMGRPAPGLSVRLDKRIVRVGVSTRMQMLRIVAHVDEHARRIKRARMACACSIVLRDKRIVRGLVSIRNPIMTIAVRAGLRVRRARFVRMGHAHCRANRD